MGTHSYHSRSSLSIWTSSSRTPGATSFLLFRLSQAIKLSLFLLLAPIIFSSSLTSWAVMVMSPWILPTDTTIFLPPFCLLRR